MPRPIHLIADEISFDWVNLNYAARPYLEAMLTLERIDDVYGFDSAQSIVRYFLSNASSYRGPTAKRLKAELKALIQVRT